MTRYALYAAPGTDPGADGTAARLRAAAESWLGRGVRPADPAPVPAVPAGWSRDDVDGITRDARRYGFHATLKAPFRLAPGRTLAELSQRLSAFVAQRRAVTVPALTLRSVGDGFFALVPGGECASVVELAADAVTYFDSLRAPVTEAELARRDSGRRLDARERALLHRFGYPYVLDRFQFHLTLTDPVPAADRERVGSALREHFAALLGRDLVLGSVALFVEPAPGEPFTLVDSHPFKGVS